jgi:pimeloyl-ACP methyl ester carboxylesterase
MTNVAIFVPGIMGSILELDGKQVWPGSFASLFLPYQQMDDLLNPDLIATDIIRSFSISEQYRSLLKDLATCEFREDNQTLYICPYDWRKDNALSAILLANLVDKAVARHGIGTEVSLIGHSMGGLVSRYYLESGDFQTRPGFVAVRRLLTLGTPHRGAPLALSAALGQEKRLFLSKEQVHQLASDIRYPALYQLMPPPGEPFAWDELKTSEYEALDVYDEKLTQALKLVPQNLEAARSFHTKLNIAKRPVHVRYFFFVGTRQITTTAIRLLATGPGKYRARPTELEDAGDGTVPLWSGMITGIQGQPVGGEHGTIYRNDELRRTMAVLLGKAGVLASKLGRVEVALRERVVNPKDTIHVALGFLESVGELDGELRIQRVQLDSAGHAIGFAAPVSTHPIKYSGMDAEQMSLTFTAPTLPGVYQVGFYLTGSADPVGADELFVQQS